jgi:dienelactone hydrolase
MSMRAFFIGAAITALVLAPCRADENKTSPEVVSLESALPSDSKSVRLQAALRRPNGAGPFGAVVLLHSCNGNWLRLDKRWGLVLASWGYVTLSVDSFGPRGIKQTCDRGGPADESFDAYRALNFLARQSYVDRNRITVVGFSRGGRLALWSVERGSIERYFDIKFRAAVGFYPICRGFSGHMTVPTLILIGENDDWTPAQDCRDMVAGRSTLGMSRDGPEARMVRLTVYPNATHGFDATGLQPGRKLFGHWMEYNGDATERATQELHTFLDGQIGRP